jgi:elongation factor 1 alpha-like protein
MDETTEERERGITVDIGVSEFKTKTRTYNIIDAPGI